MATALGALLVYDWQLALAFALVFAAAFAALRKTVLPGLFALACLPLMSWYLGRGPAEVVGTAALAGAGADRAPQEPGDGDSRSFLDRRNVHPKHDSPEL